MIKKTITIDEKWPVFSLEDPNSENDPFIVKLNEEFYKEYLYFKLKYHEYQLRLQVIYEKAQRDFNHNAIPYRFKEGTEYSRDFELNKIRSGST